MSNCPIVFLNDLTVYNKRYRDRIMTDFSDLGHNVENAGIFDTPLKSLRFLLSNQLVISSNLKANLAHLIIFWRPGIVILNGMGRFRSLYCFRFFLLILFQLNATKKTILIQNYADYRWLRRNTTRIARVEHICGSGGTMRRRTDRLDYLLVSRNEKVGLQLNSLIDMRNSFDINNINGVGLTENVKDAEFIEPIGYVQQDDIFESGDVLLVPDGYGEGFPHVLADAIMSGLPFVISWKAYINYGLYKVHQIRDKKAFGKFLMVEPTVELQQHVSMKAVNKRYIDEVSKLL